MRLSPTGIQFYIFALAFAASFVAMWTTLVVHREYAIFTDEETLPASTDIFSSIIGEDEVEE